MPSLGIDQAARLSGHSPRDIREMIETGMLPATRPAGRWMVDRDDLARAEGWRSRDAAEHEPEAEPPAKPARSHPGPIGADPVAPVVELPVERPEPEEPAEVPTDGLEALLARVEAAAIQIADLRSERDELKLALREQVSSLKQSLEETMSDLDAARARVAELEAKGYEQALDERSGKKRDSGMGAALSPLFRPTS